MNLRDAFRQPDRHQIGITIWDLVEFFLLFERNVMTQLEDLNTAVAGLQQDVADVNAKLDTETQKTELLIGLTDTIKTELDTLIANGGGSGDDLQGVIDNINVTRAQVQALGQKSDTESASIDSAMTRDTPAA